MYLFRKPARPGRVNPEPGGSGDASDVIDAEARFHSIVCKCLCANMVRGNRLSDSTVSLKFQAPQVPDELVKANVSSNDVACGISVLLFAKAKVAKPSVHAFSRQNGPRVKMAQTYHVPDELVKVNV